MRENTVYLCESSKMTADPFSDILQLTSAEAVVTGGFNAGGPWAISFPGRDKIKFFAVIKGSCWVQLEGEPAPIHFETGDFGLLAARRSFVLASAPNVTPVNAMILFSGSGSNTATLGSGADFADLGGHVTLDPIRGRLLAEMLPPWIHLRAASSETTQFRHLLDWLVEERDAAQPGSRLALAQLTQLLLIQLLRTHLRTSAQIPPGWLRALADPRISPALCLMHDDPARAWRLEELAKACAMSRTSFAVHFRAAAGVPPLTYLSDWRMRLAERALREEDKIPVAVLARSLGYSSESAFSNAFKRFGGKSPTAFRAAFDIA